MIWHGAGAGQFVSVTHTGDQFDSIFNSTEIYLFNTAVVRTGGVYAHKSDEVLQRYLSSSIFNMDAAIMHMFKPENMTAAVNQAVIILMVVAE